MSTKLLTIAFRNLRRQLRRTILTGLTFAIAVFLGTVLVAVPWSMDRIADNASKGLRLVVTERNNGRLPARYCDQIKKLPHVKGCAPEILWGAIYRDPKDPIITYGINADITSVTGSSDYQVPPDKVKLLQKDRRSALVGYALMRDHGWKIGEPVTLHNPSDSKLAADIHSHRRVSERIFVTSVFLRSQDARRRGEESLRREYPGPGFIHYGAGRPRREHGIGSQRS
jgi:hypothetical protein